MKTMNTIYTNFAKRVLITLVALTTIGVGTILAAGETGTINFGSNNVNINAASISATDNLSNTWTITTAGTTSFTQQPTYSQVGKKDEPAETITFTTTLPQAVNVTDFSAKFGGFSSTAGNITLKVGETLVGSGSLSAANDVTVESNSTATGKVLIVTVTNIDRGVKCYSISYTYEIDVPEYNVYWVANNEHIAADVVEQGSRVTLPSKPDDCGNNVVFVGWTAQNNVNGAKPSDLFNENTPILQLPTIDEETTFRAVYAEVVDGVGTFAAGESGTFKLYAIVNGNNYYAGTGINDRKLTSTTAIANAGDYTITHISNDQYTIQYGNQYISHENGKVDLAYLEYNEENKSKCHWTITRTGTKGTWRVASPVDNDRALLFTTNSSANVFKAYATSNLTQDTYYDLEIGNGDAISYQNYTTSCTREVTVTLNPNGGTGDFTGWDSDGNKYTKTVEKDESVTLPTLNDQIAYTFGGWSDGTTTHSAGTYTSEADVELTAIWTAKNLISFRTLCTYNIEYTNLEGTTHTNQLTYTAEDLPLTFTEPTSIREGYTFAGWNPASLDENTRGDQVVEAQWTANTNTPYVVKHYKEQLDGTYPMEADDTDNLTGTTATSVTPAVKSYEGFTAPSTQTVSIAADGSTEVKYHYTRNSYNLSWNVNGGDDLTGEYTSGNVKYEAAITQPNTPTRTGYTFTGWSPAEIPATMPANNLEFIAQWEALPAYAINWMVNGAPADGEPTRSVFEGQYITTLPTTPDVDCNGKEFVGWTTSEIDGETPDKPSLLYKELNDFPAITNDFTFYAVFAKGEGDNKWIETEIGNIESGDEVVITMKTYEDITYALPSNQSTSSNPQAIPVTVVDETIFETAPSSIIWSINKEGNNLTFESLDYAGYVLNCTNADDGVRVSKGQDKNKIFVIDPESGYLKNTQTSDARYLGVHNTNHYWYCYKTYSNNTAWQTLKFYKKTIVYTSYTNYSTSCVAGEFDITNTDPIYVTSAVGQKIKATDKLVLTTTDMAVGTEISLSAPNITFYKEGIEITQLTTESAEETFELEIAYQPTAENTIEQPTITLDILGQKFTFDNKISCRSLPETFAIVAKVGNVWYALPSQGLNSTTPPVAYPVEVDNMADPTAVVSVPANADWSLRQVYTSSDLDDRFAANGEKLILVNNSDPVKALNAGSKGNYLLTDAQYDGYHNTNNQGLYEWTPTTTDLETYTLTNAHRTDRTLNVATNTVFGVHSDNKATTEVRFLPIQNRYTPLTLQVVEWKDNSVVVMYNGNPAQTASVSVNGSAAEETILSSENAQRDIAVYELAATGLAANPTQRLSITIGSEKTILSIPYIIINSETTDEAVLPGTTVAARQEVAKVSDLVILKDATLTAAGAKGNPYKFRNVTVYGGGKLVVPADNGFGVNSLTLRAGGVTAEGNYDYVYPQFVLNGTWSNTSGKINLDYLTTKEQYYTFVAPFAVQTKDIHYPVDVYGSNVKADNKGSFEFEYYDGATRATGTTGWKTVEEGTEGAILNPGKGYTFLGMPKKVSVNGGSSTRQKFGIHRIPMTVTAEDAMTHENSAQTITVAPHPAEKNINSGWNLIGNPYMSTITGLNNESIQTGTIVWEDNKWEWSTDDTYNQRFIVFPSNDGQWYTTAQASNATLPAFKNFFVQIIDDKAVNALVIPHTSRTNPSAAPARHAAEEIDRDIELAIVLEKDEQNADQMDFLLNNTYGPAFDRNADFTKMMNNTNFNLYGVHLDDYLSFVAIDQYTAAQPVAIGYQVPTAGEYMLRMSDKPYVMADRIKALYVTDHEMTPEVTTDILKEPYRFTVGKAETNHTRFTISIELKPNTGDGVTTGWENVDVGKDLPIKFIYQDKLYILRNGVIYDATGKFVQTINK